MAKYTTQIRSICESITGYLESQDIVSVNTIIDKSLPLIFDFDYPIFDANYKTILEKKIIKHYYMREIGLETYGLWKLKLDTMLNEIMPYYNQLYQSELIEFNPMYDVDVTTDYNLRKSGNTTVDTDIDGENSSTSGTDVDSSGTGSSVSNVSNVSNRGDLYSETPGGVLEEVLQGTYLTNARFNDDANSTENDVSSNSQGNSVTSVNKDSSYESSTRTDTTLNNVDDYLHHVRGKNGGKSYSYLLNEYRKTFMNIDKMIIDELGTLFMGIY